MEIRDPNTGIVIALGYDSDDLPVIDIETGPRQVGDDGRPLVRVSIDGRVIHKTYDE